MDWNSIWSLALTGTHFFYHVKKLEMANNYPFANLKRMTLGLQIVLTFELSLFPRPKCIQLTKKIRIK